MSAPNPVSSPAGDLRPSEPSMEEILASIRRIIADDQSFPDRAQIAGEPAPASVHVLHAEAGPSDHAASAEPEPPQAPQPSAGDDAMHAQGIVAAPQFASPSGPIAEPPYAAQADVADDVSHATDGVKPPVAADAPDSWVPEMPAQEAILNLSTVEKADVAAPPALEPASGDPRDAAGPLASAPPEAAPLFSAATNSSVASAFNVLAASRLADNSEDLLGLAREMIRPLLRHWLDENLPSMVERMVRDEIERVARGGH